MEVRLGASDTIGRVVEPGFDDGSDAPRVGLAERPQRCEVAIGSETAHVDRLIVAW
jgi:hypothetical protein